MLGWRRLVPGGRGLLRSGRAGRPPVTGTGFRAVRNTIQDAPECGVRDLGLKPVYFAGLGPRSPESGSGRRAGAPAGPPDPAAGIVEILNRDA